MMIKCYKDAHGSRGAFIGYLNTDKIITLEKMCDSRGNIVYCATTCDVHPIVTYMIDEKDFIELTKDPHPARSDL